MPTADGFHAVHFAASIAPTLGFIRVAAWSGVLRIKLRVREHDRHSIVILRRAPRGIGCEIAARPPPPYEERKAVFFPSGRPEPLPDPFKK
jgi:hypothetical protein